MKPKIFIDGEHGTTGLQIVRRLAARSDIELLSIAEEDRRNNARRSELLNAADVAMLCLPDDAARESVTMISNPATRVVDTSTAHRTHPDWAFGFPELEPGQAERIAKARLVSNPGCYSTGAISLIRPLTAAGMMARDFAVTINAVSGYTGGGKKLIAQMEDASDPDPIAAPHFLYATGLKHKHVPEIQKHGLLQVRPLFSPSVGRFDRGMLVQVPLHLDLLDGKPGVADVHAVLAAHYADRRHVEVVSLEASREIVRLDPTSLNDTDDMQLFVFGAEDGRQANLVAVMDNLGKGASGAAVQNLELMLGLRP